MVKVSIVEIYNERAPALVSTRDPRIWQLAGIRDLLDPKKDNLKIHEDKAGKLKV